MVAFDKIDLPNGQKESGGMESNLYREVNAKNRKNSGNCLSLHCNHSGSSSSNSSSSTSSSVGDVDKCCGSVHCLNGTNSEFVLVSVKNCHANPSEPGVNNNGPNISSTSGSGGGRKRNFIVQYFKKKSQSWSRNQFVTITILSFVEFFAAAVISIQAPFYPDVARQKGASAAEYNFVFAVFEVTVFIMSPIYGAKMDILQPRRVFNWGILTTGVCCVIFGLLDSIEGRAPFIWSCLIVRIVEAMGDAAFDTASFTIIAMEFPNSVATSFAILEIWFGLGLIIGPTLGGALYQLGGYRLPFLAMGGFLFVSAIATYFLLPEPSQRQAKRNKLSKEGDPPGELAIADSGETTPPPPIARGGLHIFKMLRIPVIAMIAYSIVAVTAGVGFISANLDLHLERFELNKVAVGAVFVMNGGVYAITAPAWGWICDHIEKQKLVTLTGAIFTILGFILIGPVPHFPLDTSLVMSCIGLGLFGLGLAAILVSSFLQILNDAISHGYPDDISTYGLVSGLWTSMSALGYFIGPSLGGVFVDWCGFRWSSLLIIGGQVILIFLLSGYYFSHRPSVPGNQQDQEENQIGIRKPDAKNHTSINYDEPLCRSSSPEDVPQLRGRWIPDDEKCGASSID